MAAVGLDVRHGMGIAFDPGTWKRPCTMRFFQFYSALVLVKKDVSRPPFLNWAHLDCVFENYDALLGRGGVKFWECDFDHLKNRLLYILLYLERGTHVPVHLPDPTLSKRKWEVAAGKFRVQYRNVVQLQHAIEEAQSDPHLKVANAEPLQRW